MKRSPVSQLAALSLWASALFCTAWCCTACCSSDAGPVIPDSNPIPPMASVLAQPSTEPDSLLVSFDAHESNDPNGDIVQYDWDFTTDGTYDELDGGETIEFTYPAAGTYRCTVRVTDDEGLTDTASILVTVPLQANPPTADGEAAIDTQNPLLVHFDASSSVDTDGTIVRYDWDFNDDGTFDLIDGGPTQDYAFPGNGSYTVAVRVFDNDGLSDIAEIPVAITGGQGGSLVPPDAVLTATPDGGTAPLGVAWDASASSDSDGTVVRYDWDLDGNGTFEIINSSATRAASYLVRGDYTVNVRIFDNDGGMDVASRTIHVNAEPVALAISNPPAGDLQALQAEMRMAGQGSITVTIDGSTSFDPDGEIAQYDWDLDNDGEFEVIDGGASQQVVYTASGTWAVALRVTDNEGGFDTASADTDVNEPPTAHLQPNPPSGNLVLGEGEGWQLPVTWHAETSLDPDGQVVQWDWDIDNDGVFELIDGPSSIDEVYTDSGLYTVRVRVTDNDGGTEVVTNSVDVNMPPVADVVANPSSGNLVFEEGAETPTITVDFSAAGSTDIDGEVTRYDWDLDNNGVFEIEDGGASQAVVYTTPGSHTVAVKAYDNDGATDNAAAAVSVNMPPTVVLTADYMELPEAKGASAQSQLYWIEWDASLSFDSDGTVVQYDWDTDNDGTFDIIDGETTQSEVFLQLGVYSMGVRITDDKGASSTGYTSFEVLGLPPVAALSGDSGGEMVDTIYWSAASSFDPDGVIEEYHWDFDNDGTYDETTITPFADHSYDSFGPQTCTVQVEDNDGLTDTATATVQLYAIPIAELSGTFHFETEGDYRPYVVWDASASHDPDGGSIIQYNWDLDGDFIFDVYDAGPAYTEYYTWEQSSASAWVEIIDDETSYNYAMATVDFGEAAPFAFLNGTPGDGPYAVLWDASYSFDLDGAIVLYEWDLDNDGIFDDNSTDSTYHFDYEEPGPYECQVRATDDDGLTDTATASYPPPGPPVANLFGYVSDYMEGSAEVTWDASGSVDAEGPIVQYEWDFDFNGTYDLTTTQPVVTHDYWTGLGTVDCRVRVTDTDGDTDTAQFMVWVQQPG